MLLQLTHLTEHVRRGAGQIQGKVRSDVAVGKPPDAIGAEQSSHGPSGCSAADQRFEY
jgi:hypothetical protein